MLDFVLYSDHLSDSEIEEEVKFESAILELDRLSHAYNAFCEKVELDIREAELKCFKESGDMDQLILYYEEAKENSEEKGQGIFSKIWEGIVNLFNRIKDFFSGKEKEIEPDKKYGVPRGFMDKAKAGCDFIKTWIGDATNGIVKWIKEHPLVDGAAIGGLAIAFFYNREKIKDWFKSNEKESIPGHLIIKLIDLMKSCASKVMSFAQGKKGEKATEEDNKAASLLTKVAGGMREAVSRLCSFIHVSDKSSGMDTEAPNNTSEEKEPESSDKGNKPSKLDSKLGDVINKRISMDDVKQGKFYNLYLKYRREELHDNNPNAALNKLKKMMPQDRVKQLKKEGFTIEATEDGEILELSYISESGDIISADAEFYSEDPFTDIFGESAEESILDQEGYAMEDTETLQEISEMVDELFV